MTTMPPHRTTRSRAGRLATRRVSGAEATGGPSSTRPIDAGEMSIAAGIVEIERVILVADVGALRSGEPAGIWMTDVFEPHHVFAAATSDAFDGDLGDSGNHQLALVA